VTFSRPTFEVHADHPFLQLLAGHVEKEVGRRLAIRPEAAWTDCALLAAEGIPALLFGVEGWGLYAKEEWASVESLKQVTRIIGDVMQDFCA